MGEHQNSERVSGKMRRIVNPYVALLQSELKGGVWISAQV
jgi:hypothetical protein